MFTDLFDAALFVIDELAPPEPNTFFCPQDCEQHAERHYADQPPMAAQASDETDARTCLVHLDLVSLVGAGRTGGGGTKLAGKA